MSSTAPCTGLSSSALALLESIGGEHGGRKGYERAEVTKYIGGTQWEQKYPIVVLTARMSFTGAVADVIVKRTPSCEDTACSLRDLEIRTACEYYQHLNSVAELDAIEKAVCAPTPKAWSFITLIDRMRKELA